MNQKQLISNREKLSSSGIIAGYEYVLRKLSWEFSNVINERKKNVNEKNFNDENNQNNQNNSSIQNTHDNQNNQNNENHNKNANINTNNNNVSNSGTNSSNNEVNKKYLIPGILKRCSTLLLEYKLLEEKNDIRVKSIDKLVKKTIYAKENKELYSHFENDSDKKNQEERNSSLQNLNLDDKKFIHSNKEKNKDKENLDNNDKNDKNEKEINQNNKEIQINKISNDNSNKIINDDNSEDKLKNPFEVDNKNNEKDKKDSIKESNKVNLDEIKRKNEEISNMAGEFKNVDTFFEEKKINKRILLSCKASLFK